VLLFACTELETPPPAPLLLALCQRSVQCQPGSKHQHAGSSPSVFGRRRTLSCVVVGIISWRPFVLGVLGATWLANLTLNMLPQVPQTFRNLTASGAGVGAGAGAGVGAASRMMGGEFSLPIAAAGGHRHSHSDDFVASMRGAGALMSSERGHTSTLFQVGPTGAGVVNPESTEST